MPIRQVNGGYKWGESGKVYPNRAGAQRQAQAAYASGYKGYQNGGLASIPGYQGGGGPGFNPGMFFGSTAGDYPDVGGFSNELGGSDSWGSQIWNFLRPSITSYPSSYNRHFYRDRGGKVRKFQTRKKINRYYEGDEAYRTENPLTPQDVADFKRLQEQGKIKEDKPTGEEFLGEEWQGLTSDEMYAELGIDPDSGEAYAEEIDMSEDEETGGSTMSGFGDFLSGITGILSGIKGGEGDLKRSGIWGLLSNIFGGGFGGGTGTGTGTGSGVPSGTAGPGGYFEEGGEGIMGLLESIIGIFYPQIFDQASEDGSDWWEKILRLLETKKAIDDYNKYEVPVGQMHAQSTIGKDWGLPTKESMVMEGLGPNYAEGMQYLMPKGQPTPAATHVLGTPFVEEVEEIPGGQQGGIMGLEGLGDITPAFLEPGEFVFTKDATDNIGAKRLYKLMKQAEQMGMGGGP
jgi:hypothetical protein